MKLIVLGILLMSVFTGVSQKGYWQQHVDYTMNIDMDVNTNRVYWRAGIGLQKQFT